MTAEVLEYSSDCGGLAVYKDILAGRDEWQENEEVGTG